MKKLFVLLIAMCSTMPVFADEITTSDGISATILTVGASRHPLVASVAVAYAMFSHDPISADCPAELFNAPLVKVANADNPNGYSFYKTACEVKWHPDKYVLK